MGFREGIKKSMSEFNCHRSVERTLGRGMLVAIQGVIHRGLELACFWEIPRGK